MYSNKYKTGLKKSIINVTLIWLFVFFILYPQRVLSLGLGDIKVKSYLGQPFSAQILLTQDPDDYVPIDQISISFDTPVKNQTELINLNYARNNLSLKIESNIDQPDMVVLTSIKAIKEPILQFSIELAWNKGRLYKQYNVLLDPQNLYTSKKSSSNIQPLKNRSLPRRTGSFESSVKLSKYNHGRYGPVQYGETLSKISKSLSGQLNENYIDLINAIFVKNPAAFIGKDMNKLKQGSVLIIAKTENVAITSPTTSNAFIQGNIAAPKLKHAEKIKIVVTDNNNLGLKLTSSISLERLNLNKSSLLESEPIEEQEVIPKSMIIESSS